MSRVKTKKTENTSTSDNPLLGYFTKEIYSDHDLIQMFHCTDRTLRNHRNQGYLGFTKIGSRIYYTPIDIINYINMFHHEPYRKSDVS